MSSTRKSLASVAIVAGITIGSQLQTTSAGCLDFVDLQAFDTPTCFRGALTCIGSVDENCHIGENQFIVDVDEAKNVRDPQTGQYRIGIKFSNEGYQNSMIEGIWVEDEYSLLSGYFDPSPLTNAGNANFKVLDTGNSNAGFTEAHSHGIDFMSHFVVSEADMSKKLRRNVQEKDTRGVWQTSKTGQRSDYVQINFESECSPDEIETALEYGLIRVGVKGSHFDHKPKHKSFISCWEGLDVVYDEEAEAIELGIE